jgi:hypothetical protein
MPEIRSLSNITNLYTAEIIPQNGNVNKRAWRSFTPTMGQTQIKVEVKIEPAPATPAQLQQWYALWRKLLQGQNTSRGETANTGEG